MKKTILATALLTSTLAVSAFAYGGGYGCNGNGPMFKNNNGNNQMMMQKRGGCNSKGMYKRGYRNGGMQKGGMKMMRIFSQLNLTDDQREKMFKIMQDQRKKFQTMNEAFTKSSFDKEKFVKMSLSKRENMIKLRAETIEKAYAVLTPKQKEQFKVLIDLRADSFKGL